MGSSIVNGIVVNDGIHKVVEDMIVDSLRWICEDSDTADAVFRVLPRDVTDKVLAWVAEVLTGPEAEAAANNAYWPTKNFYPEGTMQAAIVAALTSAGIVK